MKYLYLIPEEVRNAKQVNDELGDVARSGSSNLAYLIWNSVVLCVGALLGWLGADYVDDSLLNGVLAFDGVIVGFVITAMLFSGRSQFLSKMSYEQTLLYAHKTKYMLMSQINTLFSFLISLLFGVMTMAAMKSGYLDRSVSVSLASAFFLMGCYRVLLLPFQIYDVHSFALDNLISDSEANVASDVKTKTAERLRLLKR